MVSELVLMRDDALLTLDPAKIEAYCKRYGVVLPPDPEVREIALHKARTAATRLPMAVRSESKRWLLARGYHSFDDGDVPV